GFWLARLLIARGIEVHVIHSASVAVSRERKRAKTDRLDAAISVLCGGRAPARSIFSNALNFCCSAIAWQGARCLPLPQVFRRHCAPGQRTVARRRGRNGRVDAMELGGLDVPLAVVPEIFPALIAGRTVDLFRPQAAAAARGCSSCVALRCVGSSAQRRPDAP